MTTIRTDNHAGWNRFLVTTIALLLLGMTTVAAGGRQEEQQREEDRGTRIELGNENADDGGDDDSDSAAPSEEQAQEVPAWLIGRHPLDDQLEPTISGNIERGYVPVGLDMKTGDAIVLYLQTTRIEFTRWTIQKIEDAREMDARVTAWLRDGWMPLDISLVPDGIAFLLVETDHDIDAWRIEVIPPDAETIEATYAEYQADGFVPYGLASDPTDQQLWILFLRAEGNFELPQILFQGFANAEVADGINQRYAAGALPWAMTTLPGSYFIQFIQP